MTPMTTQNHSKKRGERVRMLEPGSGIMWEFDSFSHPRLGILERRHDA